MDKVKALMEGVTQDVIAYLVEENDISIQQAMDIFYNSVTIEKLYDNETGLYMESSAYVLELLRDEIANGEFIQIEV